MIRPALRRHGRRRAPGARVGRGRGPSSCRRGPAGRRLVAHPAGRADARGRAAAARRRRRPPQARGRARRRAPGRVRHRRRRGLAEAATTTLEPPVVARPPTTVTGPAGAAPRRPPPARSRPHGAGGTDIGAGRLGDAPGPRARPRPGGPTATSGCRGRARTAPPARRPTARPARRGGRSVAEGAANPLVLAGAALAAVVAVGAVAAVFALGGGGNDPEVATPPPTPTTDPATDANGDAVVVELPPDIPAWHPAGRRRRSPTRRWRARSGTCGWSARRVEPVAAHPRERGRRPACR